MVYFDNAATTYPKPEEVYLFADKTYRECGVNIGRGQYYLATKAENLLSDLRFKIKKLFNSNNKEVVFTSTATEAINIIIQGLELKNNTKIYITPFEHNAITRCLKYLSEKKNIEIIQLAFSKENFSFDIEKIKYQFQDKNPDLIIMTHASNVCGVITPINEICDLSKKYNSINIIDMA